MFTRTSSAEPQPRESRPTSPSRTSGVQHRTGPSESGKSVIGNDLRIIGQGLKIISQSVLQVDGEIEGDVRAAEVIVGEEGKVTGMVAGQQVVIRGKVSGVICAKAVALQAPSDVDGDIYHMSLTIEQGAMFDGSSRRAGTDAELHAVMDAKIADPDSLRR
jgi:cytoskeletal protein CcmA (bactofilin family)